MRNCTWELLLDQETEQSVYVFSTHLYDPMGAAADEVRALQTQYLLEKAAQVMQAHPEASALIMDDFNARPDNDPASASKNCYNKDLETQINAAGYQDARVATEYGAKGSVHGFGKYSAILDYLFVSADFQIEDFSVLGEKINGDFYMRVLVLGGSTAGVQAGHQVTLCTPYYALGEDAAGSWAVHSKAGWEAWRQRLGCAMTFGDRETGRTQNYSQWHMCDSAHAGYQRLDQGTLDDPGKDSLSKEIQRCLHDPHGRSFHPAGRLRLLPAQDATRYAPVPLRALLPREIDNMLVRGKALSMDQDALNYARMAPDVMCVGYLAGRVTGMCVKQQCAARARALFEHLLQRQEADYASRADADVYARMRCAASLESLGDFIGRRDIACAALHGGQADAHRQAALRAIGQEAAILIGCAAFHGCTRKHIFAHHRIDKALRYDNRGFAGGNLLRQRQRRIGRVPSRNQPLDAAVMIDVRMADNDGHDARLAHMLTEQLQRLCGGVAAAGAVHDDPSMLAADKGDIGNIIAAHLIDIVRHLEQAVQRVVLRIAPQAGIGR